MRVPVMVLGGSLGFGIGSPVSGGVFTVAANPSTKMKAESNGVYAGPLSWTFAGGSGAGSVSGTVTGAGTIQPGAKSNKVDGAFLVLEGDQVTAVFQGVSPSGSPVSYPGVPVKVASAGQTTVKAD